MIVIIGALIVFCSVIGGFCMGGGNPLNLLHPSEFVIICGAGAGAMMVMAPRKVLVDLVRMITATLKGAPHSREAYNDLFKALYELFMLGRRGGMVALEEHVMEPGTSNIFAKYPTFQKETKAMEFLCNGLRPIIDGKIKPDHLKMLLEIELEAMEEEQERPVSVLTKVADAMPGFGIVAAVLGIVLTMSAISGPIEQIGEKVGAALVGTFLGIFVSYGFMNPMAANIEFMNISEMAYIRCIAASVIGFAGGMSPIMAVEVARRGLPSEVKPSADGLETMLKALNQAQTPAK
jgi:chemotaxis protein MotA